MGAGAVGSSDEQIRLRAERLRHDALEAARTDPPNPQRTAEPDYNRIPDYATPSFPVQTSAPSAFAIALKDVDDGFLEFQLTGLNARLRQGDYAARASDEKELREVQAEIARRKQGALGSTAVGGSLASDVAELSSADTKLASNVERVLNATPATAEATRQAARNEIIEETETLKARAQRVEADLSTITTMDPAARAQMTKTGVVAQLEATKTALHEQIVRNVEVAQRIAVAPVMEEAVLAAKTAGDAVAFLRTTHTQNKSQDITDRQLDGEVAAHDVQLKALSEQLGALKKREADATAVKTRIEAIPEDRRTAGDAIELAAATKVLSGVLPAEGQAGSISLQEQIKALSLVTASVSASRTQIATRYEVLKRAVDAQLISLGEKPTSGKSADVIFNGMRRIGELLGTTAPLAPKEGNFGQVNELAGRFLADATARRVSMLTTTASILHSQFGVDVLAVDAKGEPQLPLLPLTKGSKGPPVLDLKAIDAKLAQSLHALAVVTDRDKLREGDFDTLAKATAGSPLDPSSPFLHDLNAAQNRMQFVSAEGLGLLGAHADRNGGALTLAQLKQISIDLSAAPTMRETARAMLSNPQLAAQMKTPGVDNGISSAAFRRLAARASESTITGHKGALPVSIFYAGAFTDAGRLRGAIASKNRDEAVAVLSNLTQSQRHMLAIAYGDSLSKDLQSAFSGADLGRVTYAFERPLPREERLPAELAAITKDPSSIDRHVVEMESTLRTYERGGLTHSILGLRRKGVFDRDSLNAETQLRDKVDAVKARRAELLVALKGKDPVPIEVARNAAAEALVECLDFYGQVTTEVGAQVASTDRFLKASQDIATAVTVTAVATAASVATAGAATPYAGAAAATAIGVVAGTLAGSATASVISMGGQAIEKNGHIDFGEVGGAAREGAVMGFAAAVTAGASSLAMDGVMAAVNASRVGVFLQGGSRLAAISNVALKSAVMGGAGAVGSAAGTVGGAWIRGATGDIEGARNELNGIGENAFRGGIGGALLAPFAGRFSGLRGRAFDGAVGGLEQYAWNKVLGHEESEGIAQAIVNGVVIGGITEAHAKNVAAAKQIGVVPAEGHPVRLPGEKPTTPPTWKIKSVDATDGMITLERLTPATGTSGPQTLRMGAAGLLDANVVSLSVARPELDPERASVMKQVVRDADTRTGLEAALRELRAQGASVTPAEYKAKVEKTIADATSKATAADAESRAAARKRIEALPNAANNPHIQKLLENIDAGANARVADTQSLVAMELALAAAEQVRATASSRKMTPGEFRDAIAESLTKNGVSAGDAELAAARRAGTSPRLEVLEGVTLKPGELRQARDAFSAAWTKATPGQQADLGALVRAGGFHELPATMQRALIEAPYANRKVLAEELNRHGGDKSAATILARLGLSKGFQAIARGEQEQLLRYVGGTNAELSAPARAALTRFLDAPGFQNATPEAQRVGLRIFMRNQPGIPFSVPASPGTFNAPAKARVAPPTDVPSANFASGVKPAKRYEIDIDGRKIPLIASTAAQQAGLYMHTPQDVQHALELMPKAARDQIKEIHLDSDRSGSDAHWEKVRNSPNFRAYMTADSRTGVLAIHPSNQPYAIEMMTGTMIHEAGHLDSFARWGAQHSDDPTRGIVADPRWAPWKNAMTGDKLAASSYAKVDPAEDFAETYRLYTQTLGTPRHAELRNILPDRFRILDQLYGSHSP